MVSTTVNLDELFSRPSPEPKHGGCGACGSGACGTDGSRCGNGLEKVYPTTAVRFGYMRYIGEFNHAPDMRFTCGAKVVIHTNRGIEMGEQVSLTCGGCSKSVTRDQMKDWVEACGQDSFIFNAGRILREATAADLAEYAYIQNSAKEKRAICQRYAAGRSLDMKVVECECLFGGERIIVYFTAPERVDFRGLVQDLAHEFRTRIEMRQVGARDEARLLADFETCGREVCCKVFLKTLRPVNMKMAKMQKATLDPSKVSGRCGRLKCCLRYEHESYESLEARLPRMGLRIRTQHGEGVVVNRQILTQLVQIRRDEGDLVTVVIEDVLGEADGPPTPRPLQSERQSTRPARPPRPRVPEPPTEDAEPPVAPISGPDGPTEDEPAEPFGPPPDPTDGTDAPGQQPRSNRFRPRRRGRRGRGRGPGSSPDSSPPPR